MGLATTFGLAYATFLFVIAMLLERSAKAAYQRADPVRMEGFIYREEVEAYECKGGALLPVVEIDSLQQTARHIAPADRCRECGFKHFCTDDDRPREIKRSLQAWSETESGRFHRGISLTLLVLAALILLIVAFRFAGTSGEVAALAITLVIILVRAASIAHQWRTLPRMLSH